MNARVLPDDSTLPAYPETYYSISAELLPPYPALREATTADICVVGGGIAGCSAALALAERGYRVVLLEAQRMGWGASGRSGGQALSGIAVDQGDLEHLIGADRARAIWQISLAGFALLKQRIERHHIACDWIDGQMYVAIKPRQWRQLQTWQEALAGGYGYSSTRLLAREELRSLLGTERYIGGLYDTNSGHLHPLRYTLGLALAAVRAGVEIHEASPVTGYMNIAGKLRVRTRTGTVECAHLLFAGNAWLGDTVPALARKLMTIATYVIATEPLGEHRAQQLIANNAAICDTNWILDYFRRSSDHRLLFGGRVNYSGLNVRAVVPATIRRMLKVFPQLAGTRVDYAWGCLVDITPNRTPHFGRLEPNVYFLQGFSGHGIALAGIAGTLVADAITSTTERFNVFAHLPHHDFAGGLALRRPALALAMLWYRLRDRL